MTPSSSFNRLTLHLTENLTAPQGTPQQDVPFRMLLLGDFSGRGQPETQDIVHPPRPRRPVFIDRDNIDEVMAQLGIRLQLPIGSPDKPPISLNLANLESFHPDQLAMSIDGMRTLLDLRSRLHNPQTFPAAAAELRRLLSPSLDGEERTTAVSEAQQSKQETESSPEGLLDAMLAETVKTSSGSRALGAAHEWQEYVRSLAEPFLVPGADPQQDEYIGRLDAVLTTIMRAVLHHPAVQTMEAMWRGVAFLLSRLETGTDLQLFLLDISQAELAADVLERENLEGAQLYRILVEETTISGSQPWAIIGGLYTFGAQEQDLLLLDRLAALAQQANAPFVAAASPTLLGCDRLHETPHVNEWQPLETALRQRWTALRRAAAARHLGLILPRFLLRLPYGQDTEAIEPFQFEEMTDDIRHENYLWGHPAIAALLLIGSAFTDSGWSMRPGQYQDIKGLPLHVHEDEAGHCLTPCAETLLTEQAAYRIIEEGLMPLLSLKGQDTVRLARFQSIADPPTPLAGRWAAPS